MQTFHGSQGLVIFEMLSKFPFMLIINEKIDYGEK